MSSSTTQRSHPPLRVLGILGGTYMREALVAKWCESADYVIAADSGLYRALECGYMPDVVIGDFDSVPESLTVNHPAAIYDSSQEDTDCSKMLRYLRDNGHTNVTIICSEGDLLDHQLDSIHSALRTDLKVRFGLNRGIATILRAGDEVELQTHVDARISMLPIMPCEGATLTGCQWSFTDQALVPTGFTSISNKASSPRVTASIRTGAAFLFRETNGEAVWD